MKIHCGQLVEGALRNALDGSVAAPSPTQVPTLSDQMKQPTGKLKIRFQQPEGERDA